MSIVANKARPDEPVDRAYDGVNRTFIADSVLGEITPQFVGEKILILNDDVYRAITMDPLSWKRIS